MGWFRWLPADRIPLDRDALRAYSEAHKAYMRALENYRRDGTPRNLEIAQLRLQLAKELRRRVMLQHKLAVLEAIKRGALTCIYGGMCAAADPAMAMLDLLAA